MHPADMVFFWAKADPGRLAILQPNLVVTYRTLAEAVESVSERLRHYDLDRREPVAVAIHHPFWQLAVCFALLRGGIACSPIGRSTLPHLRPNGINNVISAAEGQVLSGGRNIRFDPSWLRPASGSLSLSHESRATTTNMIFFTSGTTGVPKKVVMPGGIFAERIRILPFIGEAHYSRFLVVPGLNSSFGFIRTAMIMYAGKSACLAPGFELQLRLINAFNIEAIVASPQQASGLVQTLESGSKYRFRSLNEIRLAGGICSEDLAERLKLCLCRNVTIKYGATEAGPIALAHHDLIADVPSGVGYPLPGVEIEIVDENGLPVSAGTTGMVRCRSGYTANVYAASNPECAEMAGEYWWYPGDLGRFTEAGILCIEGRADDVINCGGVKLAAGQLEEVVRGYPGVKDAGVCGVRGNFGVDEIWVGVVRDTDISLDTLKRSLGEDDEFRASVGEIFAVDQLPRNDLGKLQRAKLKELLIGLKNASVPIDGA